MDDARNSMYILQTLQVFGLVKDRNELFEPVLSDQLGPVHCVKKAYDPDLMDYMFNNLVPPNLGLGLHVDEHLLVPDHQLCLDAVSWGWEGLT
jgi:hypothetical protein